MPDFFLPLVKADVGTRLIHLRGAAEEVDRAREIMDYATAKPQFMEWSGRFEKATGGLSKGNVRAMHDPRRVIGRVDSMVFDDLTKGVDFVFKIVDDGEWKKVEEGLYTGASIGGGYLKKWKDPGTGATRYTPRISEISLVDSPCIPSATFKGMMQLQKADGAIEEVALKGGTPLTFSQRMGPKTFGERLGKAASVHPQVARPSAVHAKATAFKPQGKVAPQPTVAVMKADLLADLQKRMGKPMTVTTSHKANAAAAKADAEAAYKAVRPHLTKAKGKAAGLMVEIPHGGGALHNPEGIGDQDFDPTTGAAKRTIVLIHPAEADAWIAKHGANNQPTRQVAVSKRTPSWLISNVADVRQSA